MYAVVIHHNHEVSPEAIQALAEVLGVTVFDARQKLAGQGPVVVSTYAESAQAESILTKLKNNEFRSFISDVDAALNIARYWLSKNLNSMKITSLYMRPEDVKRPSLIRT